MTTLAPVPWEELSSSDQERVVLLLGSLAEFAAGFNISTSFTQFTSNPQDAPIRFLYHSLHQYLHGYYMDEAEVGILPVLRSLGLEDQAKEIEAVLASSMGSLTLKRFMAEYRNKLLAHPVYSPRIIVRKVYAPAKIESDEVVTFFEHALQELYWATIVLHGRLRSAYPEADKIDRERHDFPLDSELTILG